MEMRFDDAVQLIRLEYLEMPGMALTYEQARRLWNLPADLCQRAGRSPRLALPHADAPRRVRPLRRRHPARHMMPAKNNTSSNTRIRTIVSSISWPRAMATCSTAKP
jgi:hypothetical protein